LYRKADALVFASFADYTAIPLVEAMVLGTPIICSNVFSLPEQVGSAGVLFDPFDVENMAEVILRVWNDRSLRDELVEQGYKRAQEFSASRFVHDWTTLIRETLARRNQN
jgi:glycosyltransferase involved in cell wall biosynthesis